MQRSSTYKHVNGVNYNVAVANPKDLSLDLLSAFKERFASRRLVGVWSGANCSKNFSKHFPKGQLLMKMNQKYLNNKNVLSRWPWGLGCCCSASSCSSSSWLPRGREVDEATRTGTHEVTAGNYSIKFISMAKIFWSLLCYLYTSIPIIALKNLRIWWSIFSQIGCYQFVWIYDLKMKQKWPRFEMKRH